jgi:hypothetical protein
VQRLVNTFDDEGWYTTYVVKADPILRSPHRPTTIGVK